jgi:hypothetical protein
VLFSLLSLFCLCNAPASSQQLQQSVLLLKIDTEGYERSVLQGLTALLETKKVGVYGGYFFIRIYVFFNTFEDLMRSFHSSV